MKRAGRLPWPAPDELDPAQRDLHRALVGEDWSSGGSAVTVADGDGRLLGPFNAMLVSPALGGPVAEVGAALRHRSALSGRERELVILAVAVAECSGFEWHGHQRPALAEGLAPGELAVLLAGGSPDTLTEREQVLHATTLALCRRRDLTEEEHGTAVAALGDVVLVELVWLVGYYALIALVLRAFRAPLPDGVPDPFDPLPTTSADPTWRRA